MKPWNDEAVPFELRMLPTRYSRDNVSKIGRSKVELVKSGDFDPSLSRLSTARSKTTTQSDAFT